MDLIDGDCCICSLHADAGKMFHIEDHADGPRDVYICLTCLDKIEKEVNK